MMNVFELRNHKLQELFSRFESLTKKLNEHDIDKLVEEFLLSDCFQKHCLKIFYNNPIAPKEKPTILTFWRFKAYIKQQKVGDVMSVATEGFKCDLQTYPEMFDEFANMLDETMKSQANIVMMTSAPIKKVKGLATQKPKKLKIPSTLKRLVWNKHIGEEIGKSKCLCCRVTDITQMSFHCGHVIAVKNGGGVTLDNLRPICQNCNSSMSTMNMDEFINKHKI
jgi:hypothetical protein